MTQNQQAIASIKANVCPKVSKKVKGGLTMQNIVEALNSGLGIRKKDWTPGAFAYMGKDGQILAGNIYNLCKADEPKKLDIAFGNSPTDWEVVDQVYIIQKSIAKRIGELNNITDAAKIKAAAKALGVTVESYACPEHNVKA